MGGGAYNSKDFGAAAYWDARYSSSSSSSPSTGGKDGDAFFDWYQAYPALRPLLRNCVHTSSRVLMLGCGNSLLSEDMVKDGYDEIMNIDISSVVIEQMMEKNMDIPQLTYMQMDVRDMNFFANEAFDCVIDKGTLDAMMCADDAPNGASQMLAEVARLITPGGSYIAITYGAPKERVPFLKQAGCHWKIELYIMHQPLFDGYIEATFVLICDGGNDYQKDPIYARAVLHALAPDQAASSNKATPGYQLKWRNGAPLATMEKVELTVDGRLPPGYSLKDLESHFIYVSHKTDLATGDSP